MGKGVLGGTFKKEALKDFFMKNFEVKKGEVKSNESERKNYNHRDGRHLGVRDYFCAFAPMKIFYFLCSSLLAFDVRKKSLRNSYTFNRV